MAGGDKGTQRGGARLHPFFFTEKESVAQRDRLDAALLPLVEKAEDEEDDALDLSEEGIARELRRWRIVREEHIDLFVLWRRLSGMGGESLSSLWKLAGEPGSAALLRDFGVLTARENRLKKIQEKMDALLKGDE